MWNRIIISQPSQHFKGQLLLGHPVPIKFRIQKIGIIGLPINRQLHIVVIVHGNRAALNRKIFVQIVSPALGISDNIIQRQSFAVTGAVADPHHNLVQIQFPIGFKYVFVSNIGENFINILWQQEMELLRILIFFLVQPGNPLSKIRIQIHGAETRGRNQHKQYMENGQNNLLIPIPFHFLIHSFSVPAYYLPS